MSQHQNSNHGTHENLVDPRDARDPAQQPSPELDSSVDGPDTCTNVPPRKPRGPFGRGAVG